MDTITKKILERIGERLDKSDIEYGCDIEPLSTKILGVKFAGYVGSIYRLTSDLTVERKLTFVSTKDTLTFKDEEGTELARCKPGESFGESHFAYVDASVLIVRVVKYLTTGEFVNRSHEHEWTDRDDHREPTCTKCRLSKSVAAALESRSAGMVRAHRRI